jgi:hypothetical protein
MSNEQARSPYPTFPRLRVLVGLQPLTTTAHPLRVPREKEQT